jgi:hypothetical protein
MIAAVLLALTLAAPTPHARHHAADDEDEVEIELPEIEIPEINIPRIDIPEIHIPPIAIPEVSFLAAHDKRHHRSDDADDDRDDDDDDCDQGDCGPDAPMPAMPPMPPMPAMPPMPSMPIMPRSDQGTTVEREDRNGVHIYRMQTNRGIGARIRIDRDRDRDDDDDTESRSTGQARGQGSATLAVKGPITFRVAAQGGDIDVVSVDKPQVTVRLENVSGNPDVALFSFGDRVEPRFRHRHSLRGGKLHVELPKGSRLEVESMSGDVTAQRLGEAKIRTLSGEVRLTQVGKLDIQSISGDVHVDDASGPVRLHTVSGKVSLAMRNPAPQVEFQSASGSLDFKGACGKDCHVSANTVSGDLHLALGQHSSFELSYSSHSGELRDGLDLDVKRTPRSRHGGRGALEGTYGKGEGVIEADAFSGNLTLSKQ